MIIEFNGNTPKIQSGVFLASSADVIGDVVLANDVSVWYNSVIRGDFLKIEHLKAEFFSLLNNMKGM